MPADKAKMKSFYNESVAYRDVLAELSHFRREQILARYAEVVHRFAPEGGTIVDLGCGLGDTTRLIAAKGRRAIGVDISLLLLTSKRTDDHGEPALVAADISSLPFLTRSIECIALHDVIEHIPDVDRLLEEIARVLKDRGRVIIASPNLLSPLKPLRHLLGVEGFHVSFYGSTWRAVLAVFTNTAWCLQKSLSRKVTFHYREPMLDDFQRPDDDATFLSNVPDLKKWFVARGFEVHYHQFKPGTGFVGRLKEAILNLFPWLDKGFCLVASRNGS